MNSISWYLVRCMEIERRMCCERRWEIIISQVARHHNHFPMYFLQSILLLHLSITDSEKGPAFLSCPNSTAVSFSIPIPNPDPPISSYYSSIFCRYSRPTKRLSQPLPQCHPPPLLPHLLKRVREVIRTNLLGVLELEELVAAMTRHVNENVGAIVGKETL